ncbi:MAG TPA: hypothetical protein VM557_00165 [Thermoanaerobaculia bacterium]|nr:hypothetical protein [Thermoanaerobaculia bacterium]
MRPFVRGPLLVIAALALTACFEDPISEHLAIDVDEEGIVQASVSVSIRSEPVDHKKMEERLAAVRDAFESSSDSWSLRFDRVSRRDDSRALIRRRHEDELVLTEVRHAATMPGDQLSLFFSDTGLQADLRTAPHFSDLLIYAGSSARASREQRAEFDRHFGAIAEALSRYYLIADAFYAYLDETPDRALPMLAWLFDDVTEGNAETDYPLSASEDERVRQMHDAMVAVAELVSKPLEGGFTLNELALLIHDPFPARTSVRVPGIVLETEGFGPPVEGRYRIPRLDLVDAFAGLDSRWVAPDPLPIWLRAHRGDGTRAIDLPGMAQSRTRRGVPTTAEVERSVRAVLRHPSVYRIRWSPSSDEGPRAAPENEG